MRRRYVFRVMTQPPSGGEWVAVHHYQSLPAARAYACRAAAFSVPSLPNPRYRIDRSAPVEFERGDTVHVVGYYVGGTAI